MGWDKLSDVFKEIGNHKKLVQEVEDLKRLVDSALPHAPMRGEQPNGLTPRDFIMARSFAMQNKNTNQTISELQAISDNLARQDGGTETFIQGFTAPNGAMFMKATVY